MERNVFLFSVDVEDDRVEGQSTEIFSGRVPGNIDKYLKLLKKYQMNATFFVLGNVARRYPDFLRKIEDGGHEVACHSDSHIPLDQLDEKSFREDLEKNKAAIMSAGVAEPKGYRAPCFSMEEGTQWAYKVLAELGFDYSSSVLPAQNPHYGWADFGIERKQIEGIWEIPVSLTASPLLNVPFAGGVYFRALPFFWIKSHFKKYFEQGKAVVSYFHPYDIDPDQAKEAFPEFAQKPFFNWLMYYNRSSMLDKLKSIVEDNAHIMRYDYYLVNYV